MQTLSPLEAARIADEVEALAFREMWAAAPAALRERLGLRIACVADATLLLAPGIPSPMFNRAIGLGLRRPATGHDVEAIEAEFRAAGIANWWLHWNPQAAPGEMPDWLASHGYALPLRRSWAKMLRSPDRLPHIHTDLRIEPVTGDHAEQAMRIAVQAFDMPPFMVDWLARLHGDGPWRTYGVYDGIALVGTGCLFVNGQAAWLGVAAIAPSHRGRGGQAALMLRRIADAGAAGANHVVTETGEPTSAGEPNPSLANMRRCGFEQVASRLNYVRVTPGLEPPR